MTTCQVCAREIQAKRGPIAHHGYRRPQYRSGWQTDSCVGARALPYEVSRDRIPFAVGIVTEMLKNTEGALARWQSRPQTIPDWDWHVQSRVQRGLPPVLLDRDTKQYEYDRRLESLIYDAERSIKDLTEQRDWLQARFDNWVDPNEREDPNDPMTCADPDAYVPGDNLSVEGSA